ncbi:MAG: ribosomal protection-like ABC-F family protein [Pseudohongiellaceae bacterium]
MSTIICRRLTFGYDGSAFNLFSDLDLTIDTNWRCGLTGANGRGKTTLLKLLDRQLSPAKGDVEYSGSTRYFPRPVRNQSVSAFTAAKISAGPYYQLEEEMQRHLTKGDEASLTLFSEVQERYRQLGGYEVDALLSKELLRLGISEDQYSQPFEQLSGGEQSRCLLASLFLQNNSFALIDEPTNHLDYEGRELVANYLKSKKGFLLVSHDRTFLDNCIDHVVALNSESVEVQRSSFTTWRTQHHQKLARQSAQNLELKKEIRSLSAAASERRVGSSKRESAKSGALDKGFEGSRAARQMKRALNIEKRANQKIEDRRATQHDVEKHYEIKFPSRSHGSYQLAKVDRLSILRPNPLFNSVSFTINPGTRLAIRGKNGSGKTSLLDLLSGTTLEHSGTVSFARKPKISRSYQRPLWQEGSLLSKLEDAELDPSLFRTILATMGVKGGLLDQPIENLSLGQQKKIDLARTLVEPSDLIIWDEPLNYIDIDTREQIELAILRDSPTMIIVEHDEAFVRSIATDTIELEAP